MDPNTSTQEMSAFPVVQPMKAALHFDNAVGFGEWCLLMSTRATRDLRHARRTNRGTFKIIVNKMKELSHGHFTEANQKQLNRPGRGIPVYRARLPGDQRLVYQVDCIREYDESAEHQVLRVFGIYTLAQLDSRLWDSVASQFRRKDKEHRQHCDFRDPVSHLRDKFFKPGSFPESGPTDVDLGPSVLDLSHDDRDELHALTMDKFVTFSQAFLNSIIADQDINHVFSVTPQEQEIIEHDSSCYVLGRSGTGKTTTMLFKMLRIEACAGRAGLTKPRQLFVTQSRVLAGKVGEYFLKLMESLVMGSHSLQELAVIVKNKPVQQDEDGLIDVDDEENWRDDLPKQFSLLEEKHFPLFITYDKLCKLLEADLFQRGGQRQRGSMMSYDTFRYVYWPHFPQSLTKGLDPLLVFSEFMGVIKGSEQALDCAERCLDRLSYEGLSHRSQSTFASQRSEIYSIFKSFLKEKRERNQYDSADRTHWILTDMLRHGVPGKIDYLYVDEVQDNLLIDAWLLRSLCRNRHGLFWAGDTAQTISIGSSFRFNDLKAFLFRMEERNTPGGVSSQPRFFQLAVNYRSHEGIVACAHSVVKLISQFWPYAIDIIAEEKGILDRPDLKPIFMQGWDFRHEQFSSGTSGDHIEFGAKQCILVRNAAARGQLQTEFPKIGLILTLYESKGLEFDDVLLYNFFEDSTVSFAQWRVVLNALESASDLSAPAPPFSEIRHAGICSELKFLYVAITRARKKLWIADGSEKSGPMRVLWLSKGQIIVANSNAELPRFAVVSSQQEWASTGEDLFKNKRYLQAMHCFEKAGMHQELAVAEAYSLRQTARTLPVGSTEHGKALLRAANAFLHCAVETTKEKGRRVYYRNAGGCYVEKGDIRQAAKAFYDAKEYALAAEQYANAELFDDVTRIIRCHQNEMELEVVQKLKVVSRTFYLKELKLEQATALFSSTKEAVEFAAAFGLHDAHAILLEREGDFAGAGEAHLRAGRTVKAVEMFLKKPDHQGCSQRAGNALLLGLWTHLSFGVSADILNKELGQLLKATACVNREFLEPPVLNEMKMFEAICSKDSEELRRLGCLFNQSGNKPAAFLCLDHVFVAGSQFQGQTVHTLSTCLEVFSTYTELLHYYAFLPDPYNNDVVQKLFAFKVSGGGKLSITTGTFIHHEIGEGDKTRKNLMVVLRRSLRKRLRRVVLQENGAFLATKSISPCLAALAGTCIKLDCNGSHVDKDILSQDWYNTLVRVHLQQVMILHMVDQIEPGSEQQARQRLLVERLYKALNPGFYLLGSASNVVPSDIPETKDAFVVVNQWARNLIHAINPYETPTFLTTFLQAASLHFALDRQGAILSMRYAPCVAQKPPPLLVRESPCRRYVVLDVLDVFCDITSSSLSSGVLFVRHVVQERPRIDISVLCDFAENLCASLVIFERFQRTSTPHNVTLPRSWLLSWPKFIRTGNSTNTEPYTTFVDSMVALLHQVQTGLQADYLCLDNNILHDITIADNVTDVFLARICRVLCLFGYNIQDGIQDGILRDRIRDGIKILKISDCNTSFLCRRYAEANTWGDLVSAVQESTNESPMDELVYLYQKDKMQGPLPPICGVRLVPFQTTKEIPSLLNYNALDALSLGFRWPECVTPLRPTQTHSSNYPAAWRPNAHQGTRTELRHPAWHQARRAMNLGGGQNDITQSKADGGSEGVQVDNAKNGDENDVEKLEADRHVEEQTPVRAMDIPPRDEIQLEAARKILSAYRRSRHRRSPKTPLFVDRTHWFLQCLAVSLKSHWPHEYRIVFLGPLPHILLCLARVEAYARELKTISLKKLLDSEGQELEDAQVNVTQAKLVIKEVQRLNKTLAPGASVHNECNMELLRAPVKEVETLVLGLPCATALTEDLHLGIKGIGIRAGANGWC